MKRIFLLSAILLLQCNTSEQKKNKTIIKTDTIKVHDPVVTEKEPTRKIETEKSIAPAPSTKIYSNERFKEVTVIKIGEHKFLVKGKGQIFEAAFSWVIEDGHEELKKGFQMTDAGAPEWGNFSFTIEVEKKRPNSTLNLILFESSPKDGSRQYELPVVLN